MTSAVRGRVRRCADSTEHRVDGSICASWWWNWWNSAYCTEWWHARRGCVLAHAAIGGVWCGCVISGQSRLRILGGIRADESGLVPRCPRQRFDHDPTLETSNASPHISASAPTPNYPQPRSSWRLDWGEKGSPPQALFLSLSIDPPLPSPKLSCWVLHKSSAHAATPTCVAFAPRL